MNNRPAWFRLETESPQAYEAFQRYLFLPPGERSVARAWRDTTGKDPDGTRRPRAWEEWCTAHRWLERAQAYDDHLAAKSFVAEEEERARLAADRERRRAELEKREWELSQKALDKLEEMLKWPVARRRSEREKDEFGEVNVTILEPFKWNASSLARLMEAASKTARLALDMDTEKKRVEVEELTTEKIEAFLRRLEERLPPEEYARVLDALDT